MTKLPNPGARLGNACCAWRDFCGSFHDQYLLWIGTKPTYEAWTGAIHDWKAGNTGLEAAHNSLRRASEAAERATAKPLVHLGGKNYAEEGSVLALKYGKQPAQTKEGPT